MKSNSNELPQRIQDLGDGTSHFNYNIVEILKDEVVDFDYEQVVIINPVTYEKTVIALIRTRFSGNDEIAILRQRDTKIMEFEDYFAFVESCKELVKNE